MTENFYREHGIDIHLTLPIQIIDLAGKRASEQISARNLVSTN